MPTTHINLGRVQLVYRGEYDPNETYEVLDRVELRGNIYECRINNTKNVTPILGGNDHWLQITGIAKGDDGYSPTINVNESNGEITISITDKNGTTTTTLRNGISEAQIATILNNTVISRNQVLDYDQDQKVKLSTVPNATYIIPKSGALLFENPNAITMKYGNIMFNSALYDNTGNKLLNLSYNSLSPTSMVFVDKDQIWKCLDWNVYEHFENPQDATGILKPGDATDVFMYFIPFIATTGDGTPQDPTVIGGNTNYVDKYNAELGTTDTLDRIINSNN